MKQLSGLDDVFLELERGNQYMHVAGLAIYDPSSVPAGQVRFEDVLRFFESRLDASPVFRRRLARVPMWADRPYWVEDSDIDVEFHVRHIALPRPGNWRQLCIQVARLHSRPLDRSKPLWEACVIDGLDDIAGLPKGCFALYIKFHHCALDGEAGIEIVKAIHSLTPDPTALTVGPVAARAGAGDQPPTAVVLGSRALLNAIGRMPRLARVVAAAAPRLATVGLSAIPATRREAVHVLATLVRGAPVTRFSGRVSAHRAFEAVGLPLDLMRALRKAEPGTTINDIVMATVGGALHAYLSSKHELPAESMTAMMPMTLRGADKGTDAGNELGVAVIALHSEVADPLERLRAIRADSGRIKALTERLGKDIPKQIFDLLPTALSRLLARQVLIPQINVVVSNIRGPDAPLYMAGARLVAFAPLSIVVDGLGLNVTAFSYLGVMWMCVVSCREMLHDSEFFAECVRQSFQSLADAALPADKKPSHRVRPHRARGPRPHSQTATQQASA